MLGAEGFSSLFYPELEWSAAVVVVLVGVVIVGVVE